MRTGSASLVDRRLAEAAGGIEGQSVALLEELVAAAGAGRQAVDSLIEEYMRRLGCNVDAIDYVPGEIPMFGELAAAQVDATRPERCIVGRVPGAGGGRSLLLFAHPDVEPFHEGKSRHATPFRPALRAGRLHGWGVADDLAGIVMLLQSLAVLRAAGLGPGGDLALVSAPSKAHRRGIAAALHDGLMADAAVYLHPAESGHGLDEIKALSPGQIEFLITVTGQAPATGEPAHTAFAHHAVSAFEKALVAAAALRDLDRRRGETVRHPRLEHAVGRSTNIMLSHCRFGSESSLARMAGECRIGGAVSLIPGELPGDVMATVEAAVRAGAAADSWLSARPPEIAWLSATNGAETACEQPIYRTVEAVLRDLGAKPAVNPLHTSSDIRHPIVQRGIPTVGFGPLCGGLVMAGNADEWVDAGDLRRAVLATAAVIAAWCGLR